MENYFQWGELPAVQLIGDYDLRLVALSYLVAVFASYIALDFTARLRDLNNSKIESFGWLIGGSIAMGAGIWSMHFIGMLSFTILNVAIQYDWLWTLFSLLVAIFASSFALLLLKRSVLNAVHILAGGLVLGLAIASMHYTGMAAMLISLNIRYLPGIFSLSILVAILASVAAILFAIQSNRVALRQRYKIKITSAIIMGVAICGMHYTGMAASIFTPLCNVLPNTSGSLDQAFLSVVIAAVTMIILCIAFFASSYKEALNQQQYERARELGMAEIAASVLHNVGNVLNSVNVSVDSLVETLDESPLSGLGKISELLNANKENLAHFVTVDEHGKHSLAFITELNRSYLAEKSKLYHELTGLKKNIQTIKDIISTQQNLTKNIEIYESVSIRDLLNEALIIAGIDLKKEIEVIKHYGKIGPVLVDKVKLMQVLVNLILNAKDALMVGNATKKRLTIKTSLIDQQTVKIEITDSGIGISSDQLVRIFNFGFTTKKEGHGFGLHTAALAVQDMGGRIGVDSAGKNKGACFTIELPYK